MTEEDLKQLLKLQMKQATELLSLDTTKPDRPWKVSEYRSHRSTLFQVLKAIRKNSIELEKQS
ncbi:hypothetical protein [Pediococcus acidilactici]|uniref:hypothetical protein n=1 Tax=Pediococcus acidilactici TaxID=1254 RepID=UPI001BD405C4|nr:hypothetical protein [Pediococcus acidilactici]MBS9399979.1 hypothetical protein [Pediococcus acidilactici]